MPQCETIQVFRKTPEPSVEEIKRIKSVQLPDHIPSNPSRVNPFAAVARAKANRWLAEQSLDTMYKNPETLQACLDSDFPGLTSQVYFDADEAGVTLAGELMLWMFSLDNHLDDVENSHSPEKLGPLFLDLNLVFMWSFPDDYELHRSLLACLDALISPDRPQDREAALKYVDAKLADARLHPGTVYDISTLEHCSPLVKAALDIWQTLVTSSMSARSNLRWGRSFQEYVNANIVEVRYRSKNLIPSVAELLLLRRDSVALKPSALIGEYLYKLNLSDAVFNSYEMQRIIELTAIISFVHNDIWSFKKEALKGDVFNMVIAIAHDQQCPFTDAMDTAFKMLQDRIDDFERLAKDLEKIAVAASPEDKEGILTYIKICKYWISGSHYWHVSCIRYKV